MEVSSFNSLLLDKSTIFYSKSDYSFGSFTKRQDYYLSVNDLCREGNKQWSHFFRSNRDRGYMNFLAEKYHLRTDEGIIEKETTKTKGRHRSSRVYWIHPELALRLGYWLGNWDLLAAIEENFIKFKIAFDKKYITPL